MAEGTRPDNGGVEGQFDDLLSLVLARSRGEVGNDAIENALPSIVSTHPHAPSSSPDGDKVDKRAATGRRPQSNKDEIIPDEGNYDDDSEGDIPSIPATATAKTSNKATTKNTASDIAVNKVRAHKDRNCREHQEALEAIPLGKMGERMLITFGDGPCPDVEVLYTALLGTRASLQRVILDARALRRHLKEKWYQARAVATQHRGLYSINEELKNTQSGTRFSGEIDSETAFRAMDGCADGIRFDPPCGFGVSQLETLFPEEMGAYDRWKTMHDEYEENKGEIPKNENGYSHDNEGLEPEKTASVPEKLNSNRLIERLYNFDARTNRMGDDWYLKFADVRKGSFLPRSYVKKTENDKQTKKKGRPGKSNRTSWQNMNPPSAVFLHWIGFDPRSALSPPNEETTQALGYLAYDFFGKIVEKAVSLRLDYGNTKEARKNLSRSESPLLELTGGDQLEKENIEQALAEVDLKSLYSSSNIELGKSATVTQLYFGPGFEDRLELEMEEIFGSKNKSLSQQEMKARKDEENLFSEIPELPSILSKEPDVLDNKPRDVAEEDSSASAKKRRRRS